MKEIIFTIFSTICLISSGFAQDITLGCRIGSNTSILKGDYGNGRDTDYSTVDASNVTYGLLLNYSINEHLSTQLEINNRTKRMFYINKQNIVGASWHGYSNFNYIEIPILAKYGIGNKLKGFVNAGPSVNVLFAGGNYDYYTWGSHAGSVRNDYNRNIKSDFNTLTVSLSVGIGFEWNVFSNFIIIGEARIIYDLTNAAKKNEYIDQNTLSKWFYNKTKFFVFSSDIGLAYRIGRK